MYTLYTLYDYLPYQRYRYHIDHVLVFHVKSIMFTFVDMHIYIYIYDLKPHGDEVQRAAEAAEKAAQMAKGAMKAW